MHIQHIVEHGHSHFPSYLRFHRLLSLPVQHEAAVVLASDDAWCGWRLVDLVYQKHLAKNYGVLHLQ